MAALRPPTAPDVVATVPPATITITAAVPPATIEAVAAGSAPPRKPRRPSPWEIARGVRCCDTGIQRWWRRARLAAAAPVAGWLLIVAGLAIAGILDDLIYAALIAACIGLGLFCAACRWGIPRSGPSPCPKGGA